MEETIELYSHQAEAAQKSRRLPFALVGWVVLEIAVFVWGRSLTTSGADIALNAPPLFGRFDVRVSMRLLPVMLVAAFAVVYLSRVATRIKFERLLVFSLVAAFLWAASLALIDGLDGFLGGLQSRFDYLAAVPFVVRPSSFLANFTGNLSTYPIHVQGHPPGMVLFLWGLGAIGLSGAWWAAAAIVLAGSSVTAAVLLVVRELAGEKCARACAPFIILSPAAIWIVTSADALFMAISAWGIALFVLSTRGRGRASDVSAGIGGLLLGASLFLSYGVALLGLVVAALAATRRRIRPLVVAVVGLGVVVATFAGLGFWWPDGLRATLERYEAGIAARRPYGFFLVSNLAAFAVALGPAVVVALTRLRNGRLWMIVGAALVAIAIADLSGLSKGEVERIWLPFVPWVVVATAALESPRRWLGLQAASAIAVGFLVRTPW